MKAVLIAAMLSLLVTVPSSAQVQRSELTLAVAQLERSVDRLGSRAPGKLVDAVRWLRGHAGSTNPAQISRAYLQALAYAATALDAEPTRLMIDDIADELEAKVDHCEELGIGMGGFNPAARQHAARIGDGQQLAGVLSAEDLRARERRVPQHLRHAERSGGDSTRPGPLLDLGT